MSKNNNDNKIKLILYKAQENASCHQRYLKSLEAYYNQVPFEAFVEEFLKLLKHIFHKYITTRNPYVERTLEFLAQFVSFVTKSNENDTTSQDEDSSSHPFLTEVIIETLKFHDLIYEQARYYSCRFVTLILQHVGNEIHLDNFMCDAIQEAMLQRIMDPKISIRLQAVMALVRLQEPSNSECPVVKAYISLLVEANPLIRKEVVKRIAPNSVTISKISERIRDVDSHVRVAAYSRCADIGPRLFKIITRQQILQCGFNDDSEQVRTVFLEKLFPKWLSAYNDNFLEFLRSLKLDADENDIISTQAICEKVMEVFFSISTIKNIIDVLPIHNEKLVPLNDLTSEVVAYWCIVTRFLRKCPETEDYLDSILPELTPFCCYIERIIDFKTSRTLEEWEYMEYQYILYNLLDIAEHYDFSDEIGRKTLYKLITTILQNHKLLFKVAKKTVGILDKLISNVDTLTHEICQIISDIREPLVDKPTTRCGNANREFQVAQLKVKINILQGNIEDALNIQDFQKAAVIQSEIVEYRGKLDDIQKESEIVKVKISRDDPETISRCLDLLSALMELSSVKMLSPSLATCRTEFLLPLLSSNNVEINWRVLKCIALYCILDKNIAAEHAKVLCIPIITYRAIPNYNKFALMQSVATICDLVRIYGPELLFGSEKDTNSSSSTLHNATKRRLYRNETVDDVNVMDNDRLNVDVIIEIILDMLDDENADIREIAVTALSKLILNEFPVNSSLICRIILKWFNPLEKSVDKSQQKLGFLISNFTKLIKGAREVIEKAVVPIISSIANAPRTSPLADVEIDNVIQFLSAVTNSNGTTEVVHVHTDLANLLCYNIANKPKDRTVPYLTKMLLHLEIPPEKTVAIRELLTQVELLLEDKEDDIDKGPKKNLKKFAEKLKTALKYQTGKHPTENEVEQQNNLLAQNKSFQNTKEKTQETQQVNVDISNKSRENSAKNTSAAISRNDDKTFVNSSCSIEGGKSERLFSSRLKTIERQKVGKNRANKKNLQNDTYTNKDVTKKIDKLSNTIFNQEMNNKSRNNLEILRKETNTNKNENGGCQSVKHTNKKKADVKNCEPKSKKGVTDVESDSTATDNEADGRKILRRSKRQKTYLKSTDSKKQKVSEVNRIKNLTVDSDQAKVSNTNTNNLGSTTCTILRNSFPDKSLVEGVHGVKRKKLRRRKGQNSLESEEKKLLQNSIASEETILYTILDNSKQASVLINETSESKSSEYSSYSIDRTQRNSIISETSSESESTSSSPVKRPVGKIKKK